MAKYFIQPPPPPPFLQDRDKYSKNALIMQPRVIFLAFAKT